MPRHERRALALKLSSEYNVSFKLANRAVEAGVRRQVGRAAQARPLRVRRDSSSVPHQGSSGGS